MDKEVNIISLQPYTKEWLEELCKDSFSYLEVLRKAGRKQCGGNNETLRKKIKEFDIDVSHFTGQSWNKGKTVKDDPRIAAIAKNEEKYKPEEVFCKNSMITQSVLRGYVKRYQAIPYKCEICGCDGNWQDGKIALEIHHKDGDSANNELSNLTYLCPNCHALTDTYRRRKKINPPKKQVSEKDFIIALQTTSNIRQALIQLGLNPQGGNYTRAKRLINQYKISQK